MVRTAMAGAKTTNEDEAGVKMRSPCKKTFII
jgi:hypothetical protein